MRPTDAHRLRRPPGRGRSAPPSARPTARGQALVFAVLTFAILAYFGVLLVNVAARSATQVRMQNAADEAALAAAWAEADGISQIAWLNEAMAEIHYHRMRSVVDNATLGTLAALKEIEPAWSPGQSVAPPDWVVGLSGATERWETAYRETAQFLPEATHWFDRLSELQQGIAGILPQVIKQEARFRAERNGAHRTLVYPAFVHVPRGTGRYRLYLDLETGPGDAVRWRAVSPDLNLQLLAERIRAGRDRETWRFRFNESEIRVEHDLNVAYGEQVGERMRVRVVSPDMGTATYVIRMVGDPGEPGQVIAWSGGEAGLSLRTGQDTAGDLYFDVDTASSRLRLRYGEGDALLRWRDADGDGVTEADEWVPVEGEALTVSGVEIPTHRMRDIRISDEVSLRLPLHPGEVPEVTAEGFHISFRRPLRFYVRTSAGPIHFTETEARHQGLGTLGADGLWHRLGSVNYHRMTPLGGQTWEYDNFRPPAKLEWMDRRVFATHAIMDHAPEYDPDAGGGWGGPVYEGTGDLAVPTRPSDWPGITSDDERFQEDGGGRWARFPLWAQPYRAGAGTAPDPHGFGGFFEPEYGGALSEEHHHQTRVGGYCGGEGRGGALRNYDPYLYPDDPDLSFSLYEEMLPRPCGFWHEFPDNFTERLAELRGRGARVITFRRPGDNRRGLQVRCPLGCRHGFQSVPHSYTADAVTRVRVDLSDVAELVERRFGESAPTYLQIPWDGNHRPLAATVELHKHATIVAVWAPGGEAVQWGWSGPRGAGGPSEAEEAVGFPGPGWGHYAIASSRIAVLAEAGAAGNRFVTLMPRDPAEDGYFRTYGLEAEDPFGRPRSWQRELWVRSGMNLFEPAWVAALTPLDTSISVNDFYFGYGLGEEMEDSGAALAMRLLREQWNSWNSAPDAAAPSGRSGGSVFNPRLGGIRSPRDEGRDLDWEDPGLSEVLLH